MIAAIYARKSTDQNGVGDEEKSVTRQIEHAKAYAAKKGWRVAEDYIFVDDGISGAEFVKRPGFLRLMNALKPRPPFQVLIMSEESRLGREQIETAYALKQLITAGVRVYFYLEDRERTLDSPTDKLMLSVTAFSDELERERARQRTYDAMVRKARAGHVTGGRVFGFDNVELRTEDGRRQRVERRVNGDEALVVRRIFELYAGGLGLRSIAIRLNDERALAPLPRRAGRPRGWAPSSVREILYRSLYRGQVVWNRTKKRDQWGRKHCQRRAESEWLTLEAPELRIVSEELWQAAHARLDGVRQSYLRNPALKGQLWGRPVNGKESRYLLTGFAVCGACGGSLHVRTRSHGRHRVAFYGCTSYHNRGSSVCTNNLELRMTDTDAEVLAGVEEELLHPAALERGIQGAIAVLTTPAEPREDVSRSLVAELADVEARTARLTEAIQLGGTLAPLVMDLKALTTRREQLERRLKGHDAEQNLDVGDLRALEAELRGYLAEWTELLHRHAMQARQMLRKIVDGRIRFTPKDGAAVMEFRGSLGRLISGLLVPKALVAPTGSGSRTCLFPSPSTDSCTLTRAAEPSYPASLGAKAWARGYSPSQRTVTPVLGSDS